MEPMLNGYNAFITGAGSGIGRSTAIHFSRHGVAGLAIADINGDSIREVANSIANEFPRVRVLPFVLDVTDAAEVKRSLAQTVKELGRLDVAVNNAGALAKNQLTHTLPNEEWQRIINLNINSVFYCQKEELGDNEEARYLLGDRDLGPRRGRGTIVNTASVAGLRAAMIPVYQSAYVATKHAVVGLTKADAISYSPYNIRVNAICPGYASTPLLVDDTLENKGKMKILTDNVPLKRLVLSEEVADGIVFLASQMNSAMQGSTLSVDLGISSNSGAGWISKM